MPAKAGIQEALKVLHGLLAGSATAMRLTLIIFTASPILSRAFLHGPEDSALDSCTVLHTIVNR
jgi:hypothetical protein